MADLCAMQVHPWTFIHACADVDTMDFLTFGSTLWKIHSSVDLHRLRLHSVPFHPFLSTNQRELLSRAVARLFTENSGTLIICLSDSDNRHKQNTMFGKQKRGDSFNFAPINFFPAINNGKDGKWVFYSFWQSANSQQFQNTSQLINTCVQKATKEVQYSRKFFFWPKVAKTWYLMGDSLGNMNTQIIKHQYM